MTEHVCQARQLDEEVDEVLEKGATRFSQISLKQIWSECVIFGARVCENYPEYVENCQESEKQHGNKIVVD